MFKKLTLLFLFLIIFIVGCTQQQFGGEFAKLNETNAQLQKQISTLKTENAQLKSEITSLKMQNDNLSSQISNLQVQVAGLSKLNRTVVKNKAARAKAEINLYSWLLKNVFTDKPTISGPKAMIEISKRLVDINNPVLTSEWNKVLDCSSAEGANCSPETLMALLISEAQKDIDSAFDAVK